MTVIKSFQVVMMLMLSLLCVSCLETRTPYDRAGFEWAVIDADKLILLIEAEKGVYTRGYTGSGRQNNRELRYYSIEYKWPLEADVVNPAKSISLLYENRGEHLLSFSREEMRSVLKVEDMQVLSSEIKDSDKDVLTLLEKSENDLLATAEREGTRYLLLRNGTLARWDSSKDPAVDNMHVLNTRLNPNGVTKWLVDDGQLVFFPYTVGQRSPNISFFPNAVTVFSYERDEKQVYKLEVISNEDLKKVERARRRP